MKINYADRKNDENILKKNVKIIDSNNKKFDGKITLIELVDIQKELIVGRPDGSREKVIAKDYKIMTFFPNDEKYSMTVMIDDKNRILQWYFDINKYNCKYENQIPYSEDLFLDVVLLPNGNYYNLDEDDLEQAYKEKSISLKEYYDAYNTRGKIIKMIENDFSSILFFTVNSLSLFL